MRFAQQNKTGVGRLCCALDAGGAQLGDGGDVQRRFGAAGFFENFAGHISAAATTCGNTQAFAQLIEVIDTACRGTANLFVGNRFADADVHISKT